MTLATVDGEAVGRATRAVAAASGRSVAYQVLIECGWRWAASPRSSVLHLVPPDGDVARCSQVVYRAERLLMSRGVDRNGCRRCKAAAAIPIPPTTRS